MDLDSALSVVPVRVFLFLVVFLLAMPPLSTLFKAVRFSSSVGVLIACDTDDRGAPASGVVVSMSIGTRALAAANPPWTRSPRN